VKVHSNDSSSPTTHISVKASAYDSTKSMFTWDPLPLRVDFGELLVGEKGKITVKLTNQDSLKRELTVVSPLSEEYIRKFKIKKNKLKPGKSTKIEFEVARDIPLGRFYTSVTLEAKGNPESRITIPVRGQIVKEKTPPGEKTKVKKTPRKKTRQAYRIDTPF